MAVGTSAFPPVSSAAAHVRPWIAALARFGMAAKGAVYLTVGVLAARTALAGRGRVADKEEALVEIVRQPMGRALLLAIAIGLLGYALWRVAEGLLDPERRGSDARGLAMRAGYVLSGVIYGGLAVSAAKLFAWGQKPHGGASQSRELSREILELPFGAWLLGAAALGVVIYGVVEVVRGLRGSFREHLTRGMTARHAEWAVRIGRLGHVARGVVFAVIGGFGIAAARAADERHVQGLAGALRALARTGGGWVLGLVGVGLAAYGVYMFFEARFRRIAPP
jgi:hypothetical protein